MDGFILNLAPTGMIPTKAMNPHTPLSVTEIVADARRCVELGANILHLHARDDAGQPTWRKEVYARIIGGIRTHCPQVVICVSLSGRDVSDYEKRADPLLLVDDLKPDMASLTLASLNFATGASLNSPKMIQLLAARMLETGVKPELEVFDAGMVNYARYLADKGLLQPPFYVNILLGNIASAQATPAALGHLISELPAGSLWTGGGIGPCQLTMNTMGLMFGQGLRVGLEDYLWMDPLRQQIASNPAMVQRAVDLGALLGKKPASALAVRRALGLPLRA